MRHWKEGDNSPTWPSSLPGTSMFSADRQSYTVQELLLSSRIQQGPAHYFSLRDEYSYEADAQMFTRIASGQLAIDTIFVCQLVHYIDLDSESTLRAYGECLACYCGLSIHFKGSEAPDTDRWYRAAYDQLTAKFGALEWTRMVGRLIFQERKSLQPPLESRAIFRVDS